VADNWRVFGLRAGPDAEFAFVAHAKGEWVVKKGRNKPLEDRKSVV